MACISSPVFSCLVLIQLGLNHSEGLGKPLSPHLFVLLMDTLSHLLREATDARIPFKHGDFSFSHALYADDVIIAFRTNGCRNVIKLLQNFSELTGLSVNYNKSAIYFSKWAGRQFRRDVSSWLGIQQGRYPLKYLGDLISDSRVKVAQQQPLVDVININLPGGRRIYLAKQEGLL